MCENVKAPLTRQQMIVRARQQQRAALNRGWRFAAKAFAAVAESLKRKPKSRENFKVSERKF